MTKKQFDSIIKKAVYHGNLYKEEMEKLENWVEEKYGCDWGNCDMIIDLLEFGCGRLTPMTFEDFKKEIKKNEL